VYIGLTKAPQTHIVSEDGRSVVPITLTPAEIEARQRRESAHASRQKINVIYQWFNWYDNQIKQYERARRINSQFEISPSPDGVFYRTVEEMDNSAAEKQLQVKILRQEVRDGK